MDIFDTITTKPQTKKGDIFDRILDKRPLETQPGTPTPKPQQATEPPTGKPDMPWMGFGPKYEPVNVPEMDVVRSLKDYANIGSEFLQTRLSGKRWANKAAVAPLSLALSKIEGKPFKEVHKEILSEFDKVAKRVPKLEVAPPSNAAEKIADIVTGTAKFATRLMALKKVYPQASGGKLWEMENLSSGGIPGMGYVMHGIFNIPGEAIVSKTAAAKVTKLALESGGLMGLSALEQKIDTGEIDIKQIAIAGALPLALRTPKAIKALLRKQDPRVIKGLAKTYPGLIERMLPAREVAEIGIKGGQLLSKKLATLKTTNETLTTWARRTKELSAAEHKAFYRPFILKWGRQYKSDVAAGMSRKDAAEKIKVMRKATFSEPQQIHPLKLTTAQKAVYDKKIKEVYPPELATHAKDAETALLKLQQGRIPAKSGFDRLEPVLGREATTDLYLSLVNKKGVTLLDVPTLIRDVPKALRFGFDPQTARGLSKTAVRHPKNYFEAVKINIRAIFSKKYANKAQTSIEKSKLYDVGKKEYGVHYLSMNPWASVAEGTKLQQYGDFHHRLARNDNKIVKSIGKWLVASERGANLGMNYGMNKLVEKGEKDFRRYVTRMAKKGKAVSKEDALNWRIQRGNIINAFSKRVIAEHPRMKEIQQAANWVIFSPAYAVSGPTADIGSFVRLYSGLGFENKRYGMEMILTQMAALSTVSGIAGYAGYKKYLNNPTEAPPIDGSANPFNPLWGKIRQGNDVYDLGFGDISVFKTLLRMGLSAHLYAKEKRTGKQVTEFRGKKAMSAKEAFHRFLNSKRTLWLGIANQFLTKKDFLGKPSDLKGTVLDNLPFEFFAAFVEAGEADGLWDDMEDGMNLDVAKESLKNLAPSLVALGGIGTASYPVRATETRYKFKDAIAKQKWDKKWDDLSVSKRNKLKATHRKQFEILDEKVRKERATAAPFSRERIEKEEREAQKRVAKMLSKPNRKLVKDIDLNISRSPKGIYLNDERYNRFQALVAQFVENKLSRIDFTEMKDTRRVLRIKLIVKAAKDQAFAKIRKEIK